MALLRVGGRQAHFPCTSGGSGIAHVQVPERAEGTASPCVAGHSRCVSGAAKAPAFASTGPTEGPAPTWPLAGKGRWTEPARAPQGGPTTAPQCPSGFSWGRCPLGGRLAPGGAQAPNRTARSSGFQAAPQGRAGLGGVCKGAAETEWLFSSHPLRTVKRTCCRLRAVREGFRPWGPPPEETSLSSSGTG